MSSELDPTDKELLKDIQVFNRHYSAAGWHIEDKAVTEDLSNIRLFRSSIASTQFLYVAWKSAILTETQFTNVDFEQADFTEATLRRVVFKDCKFVVCSFAKATLTDCQFIDCTSEELTAREAVFESCKFEKFTDDSGVYGSASLENTSFESCRLDNSSFYGTKFNQDSLRQCGFNEAIFSGIRGSGLSFEDCTLYNCSFEGSQYGAMAFKGGQSKGLTFKSFNPSKISFENCARIQTLTVRESFWTAPAIADCQAISELTINHSRMLKMAIERSRIAYFEMRETEVSGDSRVANCSIAGLNLEKSALRRLRMSNCEVAMYLVADGATMDGVALTGVSYAPGLKFSAQGVTYLNASAEFGVR